MFFGGFGSLKHYNEVEGLRLFDEGSFEEEAWSQLLFFSGLFLMLFLSVLAWYRELEVQVS